MMNNIDNLDYWVETTLKDNKLQIEYKGKIFKENPALVTKNTAKVNVMETLNGYIVEMDLNKGNNLNFSISNINNEEVKNTRINKKCTNGIENITDLTVIEKLSLWKKMVHYIKKITNFGFTRNLEKEK